MSQILAKSDGTLLITHLKDVAAKSLEVKNELISEKGLFELTGGYLYYLEDAALFHDIGKATTEFQKRLKKGNDDFEDEIKTIKFAHNEVGYAFMRTYTNLSPMACKLIYWHHGIYDNNFFKHDTKDILKGLKKEDIERMKSVVLELKPSILRTSLNPPSLSPSYYSSYYDEVKDDAEYNDAEFMTALSYLITADRMVSGYNKTLVDILTKPIVTKYNNPYKNERFSKQEEISLLTKKTTVINAPAGFGKTLTGLLWNFHSNKRLIWVCPRLFVAESVYGSIKEELSNLGVDLSVSLVVSNEIKDSTIETTKFGTDIVVTNIDTYLRHNYEFNDTHIFLNGLNVDVIFDEYHELVDESALFSLMVKMIKARSTYSKANTILLSATPFDFSHLLNVEVTYLPNKHEHFEPVHNIPYDLKITQDSIPNKIEKETIHIKNSITLAQRLTKETNHNKLVHSKFVDEDKKLINKELLELYGKHSKSKNNRVGYIGTHVVQASLDISFKSLIEDVLSPFSTVQRIGRCNRFGTYDKAEITINRNSEKSNITITNLLFNNELKNRWYDMLNNFGSKKITLTELYIIFNYFCKVNSNELEEFINLKYIESCNRLIKIHPTRNKYKKSDNPIAGNKLRSNHYELYYTCNYDDSNELIDPLTQALYGSYMSIFKEDGSTDDKIKNYLRAMSMSNDNRFDYSKYKGMSFSNPLFAMDNIRLTAKHKKTPYFVPNFKYNKILGVYPIDFETNDNIIIE